MGSERTNQTRSPEPARRVGALSSLVPPLAARETMSPTLRSARTLGDHAMPPLFAPVRLQAKLAINQPGNMYEQEADRVAAEVMASSRSPGLSRKCTCGGTPGPDGECAACRAKPLSLQPRAATEGALAEVPPIVHEVLQSPGQPLDPATRAFFEPRFGHDFSQVRVHPEPHGASAGPEGTALTAGSAMYGGAMHTAGPGQPLTRATRTFFEPRFGDDFSQVRVHTGARAAASAQAVHARAYAIGNDVVFGQGQYSPETPAGRYLLAHELTHVVQQNGSSEMVQRFSTEDCDSTDVTLIDESHNRAIELVNAAIARLTADPVTADTQRHFANHFGGYGSLRRDIVVGHFKRDLELLTDSEMTYECETECDEGEPAYTYWVFGDIHICLPWLRSQVLTERGETFVHELHHWDGLRGHLDLGYHKNNQDNKTTWVVAVNNADAYSELAQDLYEQP